MLHKRRRIIVAALGVAAAALLIGSFFFPYWEVVMHAPQYPQGLSISVYLNKVVGDVFEVNLLNHYIGMEKLQDAAGLERSLALYGLAFVGLCTIAFVFSGRKTMSLLAIPALVFPLAFIVDLSMWLYRFGHNLDPRAPITFTPFTPKMIGEGIIGQFSTMGSLGVGFYMALLSFLLVIAALILRFTVCNACPFRERCSITCSHLFFWPPPEYQERLAKRQ